MKQGNLSRVLGFCCGIVLVFSGGMVGAKLFAQEGATATVEFNRDILPILSDRCFRCHGPDAASRQADLRLDLRDEAIKSREGRVAILPGNAEQSELMRRIESREEDLIMPPADSGLILSRKEIQRIRQWIDGGARYQKHWSFLPLDERVAANDPGRNSDSRADDAWTHGSIDEWVRRALAAHGFSPSPRADKATLLRRATLTLTGLPPTLDEIDQFLADTRPDAYERVIDRLLASPRFGERMALEWLDGARYADTNGYYNDTERQAWPWREWVIQAFNRNLPFDQFTIEQLAGDLLSNPTTDQWIATGFNRNHMVTNETGIIEEEYRVGYVADRLDTTSTVWLGLTVGCARCHDHKYDPLSQREYYQLFAAFNNIDETGLIKDVAPLSPAPSIMLPTADQERELSELANARERLEADFKKLRPDLDEAMDSWEASWSARQPKDQSPTSLVHVGFDDGVANRGSLSTEMVAHGTIADTAGVQGKGGAFDATQYVEFHVDRAIEHDTPFTLAVWIMPSGSPQGCVASKMDSDSQSRGFEILWYKSQPRINLANVYGTNGIEVVAEQKFSGKQWRHLVITYDGSSSAAGLKVYVDGEPNRVHVRRDNLSGSVASSEPWRIAWKGTGIGFDGGIDEFRLFDRVLSPEEIHDLHWREFLGGAFQIPKGERTRQQSEKLDAYFIAQHGTQEWRNALNKLTAVKGAEERARRDVLSVSVMQEMKAPRKTHLLVRGQYDQHGEEVSFAIPASLGELPADAPANRLGFAKWLVAKDNPLTARVAVNRLWMVCFGEGIVRTPNDFGLQGEPPSHPELLDWLAIRFRDGTEQDGPWNVKALLKLIMMSETFQQSSNFSEELLAADPENRWLARGPRYRLSAETLRDQALAMGGLLVEKIGGPSVKPYQPPGIWEAVSYNGEATYVADQGESLYRRGLYTYWKRQAPPPGILTFDGPTREVCMVKRPRTNTPLQALVLLNDDTFVEAARGLASRALKARERPLEYAFRTATGRVPSRDELARLEAFLGDQVTSFRQNPDAARALLKVGSSAHDPACEPTELAAWTMLASILLNLDEVVTLH